MTMHVQSSSHATAPRCWPKKILRWCIGTALIVLLAFLVLVGVWRAAPPTSTLMLGRYLLLHPVERQWVSLDRLGAGLPAAVIMSEDGQFCRHHGVDWQALGVVLNESGTGDPSRGASTIAMQTAKNLFLWPQRSYLRKGLEIPMALIIDAAWPKRRVLEVYLNIAEWGDGLFGAEAAARRYFGKSAEALSSRESALLAAALPNPRSRDPNRPNRRQAALAHRIELRMRGAEPWLNCLR